MSEDTKKIIKKKSPVKVLLVTVLIILVAALVGIGIYMYSILNNASKLDAPSENDIIDIIKEDQSETSDPSLSTVDPATLTTPEPTFTPITNEDFGVINIMVFGMDNRYNKSFSGRSDVNIILTLDTNNNEVRMTSIMRDTLIYLPSQDDYNRINAAIVYEKGPEGAVVAIEKEFNIDIDHFIISSFKGVKNIIDALGGVRVHVSHEEVWQMNGLIQEMNKIYGYSTHRSEVNSFGSIRLNGIQSVAYMRVRKEGGVFMRDERQKKVLAAARDELSTISLSELDDLMKTVSDWVKTDMDPLQLVSITNQLYKLREGTFRTTRAPFDDHYETARYNSMAIIQYDKEYTLSAMHDFIYRGIVSE
ncbi:MAG: LCP family protein [Clostridiales bacterium]|nr:LCP family protein [Clostridiales bacterium]